MNPVQSLSQVWRKGVPMDCSIPGLPVRHQLPELAQTHVHGVSDAIQPSHILLSPSPLAFNLSQHPGLFQWVSSLHQVVKVLEFQLLSFYVWEDARVWAHCNHSFHTHLSCLGPVFHIFSPSEFLSVYQREWLQPCGCQMAGTVLHPRCPLCSEIHIWRAGITDDYGILVYWYGRK